MIGYTPAEGDHVRVKWDPYGEGLTARVGLVVAAKWDSVYGWVATIDLENGRRVELPAHSLDPLPRAPR